LFDPLPEDSSLLQEGITYTVTEGTLPIELSHCTSLNCISNGHFGTLGKPYNNGTVSPDNYKSKTFSPIPGTTIRIVGPVDSSTRCEECVSGGGVCVTMGPHDSNEIYNLTYKNGISETNPQYKSLMQWVPVGSVVRLFGERYSQIFGGKDASEVVHTLQKSDSHYLVGISNRGHTLSTMRGGTSRSEITYILPDDLMVGILTIPDEAKLWARCWEVGEPAEPFQEKEYWGLINELPLGSLVRVPKETKGRRILQDSSVHPEGSIGETVFTVDSQYGRRILRGVFRDSCNFEENDMQPKDFVIPDDLVLNVITTPTESQIWAQVREVDNSNIRRSSLRDTFRNLVEKLLRDPH